MEFIEKGGRGVLKRNFYITMEGGKGELQHFTSIFVITFL